MVWSPPVLWGRVATFVLWEAEEKWKARGWRLPFGGENDNENVLPGCRVVMWVNDRQLLAVL